MYVLFHVLNTVPLVAAHIKRGDEVRDDGGWRGSLPVRSLFLRTRMTIVPMMRRDIKRNEEKGQERRRMLGNSFLLIEVSRAN